MVTEDYVSFETAKLLKEKGFNESIETLIGPEGIIYRLDENSVSRQRHSTISNSKINIYSEDVSCPTTQMAMKWLREVHNISIEAVYDCSNGKTETISWWLANIKHINSSSSKENDCLTAYDSYEESCEAAIKYCLENLI